MNSYLVGSISSMENPFRDSFKLHTHECYEVYVFLGGDTDYIVEGTAYNLEPYDIIILNPGEMHRAYHKSQKKYTRIVFNVYEEFFEENNCTEYKNVFTDREMGKKNKISAEFVKNSGLAKAITRWLEYTEDGKKKDSVIATAVFIEILHIMNNINALFDEDESNNMVSSVISYINKNFCRKITLEELEEEFFVSKYHLCREFKKSTGHTIIGYINNKRLSKIKELYKTGMSINKACVEAGFSSYSSFYKAYLKEFGVVPHEGLN